MVEYVSCPRGAEKKLEYAVLEDALVYVSLDLIASLTYVYLASLQFDMDYGHSVDQEHHVSPSVAPAVPL